MAGDGATALAAGFRPPDSRSARGFPHRGDHHLRRGRRISSKNGFRSSTRHLPFSSSNQFRITWISGSGGKDDSCSRNPKKRIPSAATSHDRIGLPQLSSADENNVPGTLGPPA